MWRSFAVLAAGVLAVALVVLALVRGEGAVHELGRDRSVEATAARADAGTATTVDRVDRARALIAQIQEASHALMPEGFGQVYVGMGIGELREARPRVRLGRPSGRSEVWEETTEEGARVVYLSATSVGVVTQVQFLSRLDTIDALLPHFQALRRRYGEPTGFWDCPEQPEASPVRRITWRREGASVMEAMLVHPGGVSVTLVITATGDIPVALARSHCVPVTRETLGQWPIATELRGERIPFTNAR